MNFQEPRPRAAATTALVCLLVAVVAWQVWTWREHRSERADRREVLAIAKRQVLDLTTLDSTTVNQKVTALSERTAGAFREQLDDIASTFSEVVRKSEIVASGKVDAAALTDLDEDSATVLVASTSEVTSKDQKRPVTRTYRMLIDLQRDDDRWVINGMEFVS